MSETLTHTTRPFMSGRSQAIRIPKEYRLEDSEVYVNRIGDLIVITPVSSLQQVFFEGLGELPDDFLADGRPEETENKWERL